MQKLIYRVGYRFSLSPPSQHTKPGEPAHGCGTIGAHQNGLKDDQCARVLWEVILTSAANILVTF